MFPAAFDESNEYLGPPPGMSPEEVTALSVWRGRQLDGAQVVVSCWKPTAEELEEIQRTGRVWLIVHGDTMPPAALSGHHPFVPAGDGG